MILSWFQKKYYDIVTYDRPPGIEVFDYDSTSKILLRAIVSIDVITMKSRLKTDNDVRLNEEFFTMQYWVLLHIWY